MNTARPLESYTVWAIVIGSIASAGIGITGLLLIGWNPGPNEDYHLTHAIEQLLGMPPLVVGAGVLLFLIPLPWKAYGTSLLVVPSPILCAIVYETSRNSSSHNLWPLEFGLWILMSALVHVPTVISKGVYWAWHRAAGNGNDSA